MEKLDRRTPDLAAANFDKLAELFPGAVTETTDAAGNTVRGIDADALRAEIGAAVLDDSPERYRFTWPGKGEATRLANAPLDAALRLDRAKSLGRDGAAGSIDTDNVYIEGDNLAALKLLQHTYLGKVKMIYIDPPYNTGGDFIYRDKRFLESDDFLHKDYQLDDDNNRMTQNLITNGRFHTDWLNMIYPRLRVAKDLLRDDGVIFISIDDHEQANLKKLCDEVFGEGNFVGCIPWQSRASIQNDTDFSVNHEYILVYAKNRRRENRRLKETNADVWHRKDSFVCRPLPLDASNYTNPDNDPRGPWKADPFDAPHIRPNLTYAITNPNTGERHLPPRGRCWRVAEEKFLKALEDNRIVWSNNGRGRPQLKVYYEEKKEFGAVDNSWFSAEKVGTTTNGTKELMQIFDGAACFDNPKPVLLLRKLLTLANLAPDSLVLDFFSGSATTAHAVMQLNAEDGGRRRFIMVQWPEECTADNPATSEAFRAGFANICELGEERIRRAADKIRQEHPEAEFDGGFCVFRVDEGNLNAGVSRPADEYKQEELEQYIDNIKPGRTPEDLLIDSMLALGVPLDESIEETTVDGKRVFDVNDGFLLACFDENVTEATVTAIAKRRPDYAVFRDSGMASDSVLTNFEQLFNAYSPGTVRRVI